MGGLPVSDARRAQRYSLLAEPTTLLFSRTFQRVSVHFFSRRWQETLSVQSLRSQRCSTAATAHAVRIAPNSLELKREGEGQR